MFDLTIFLLSLDAGREQHELPGLLVTNAPRRAARLRAQDQLVLYMNLLRFSTATGSENEPAFRQDQQQEILERLGHTYFTYTGSVTAGMRAVVTQLNDFLLKRNLKSAHEGQLIGIINLAVIHAGSLFIAHAGPTHTFVLGKTNVDHFNDGLTGGMPTSAGRGLGLGRQAIPRFYQVEITPGALLLVSADPPAIWNERTLANSPQLSFDLLRRRLLSDAGGDLHAAAIRFQSGKGQIAKWKPGERMAGTGRPGVHRASAREITMAVTTEEQVGSVVSGEIGTESQSPTQVESLPVESVSQPEDKSPVTSAEPEPVPGTPGENSLEPSLEQRDRETGGTFLGKLTSYQPPETPEPRPRIRRPMVSHDEKKLRSTKKQAAETTSGEQTGTASTTSKWPRLALFSFRKKTSEVQEREARAQETQAPEARTVETIAQQARIAEATKVGQPSRPVPHPGSAIQRGWNAFSQNIRAGWQRGAPVRGRIGQTFSRFRGRIVPRRRNPDGRVVPLINLTAGMMLSVAVVVPIVVVAVALAVYFQAGRSQQFEVLFLQAQQVAAQAAQQEDPVMQRENWTHAYELVRKAEQYGQTSESEALRTKALNTLDELEGIVRLDYRPASTSGFGNDVNITRVVSTLNDVYLLDSSQGRILRLYRTATGYELDTNFRCGPGQAGTIIISQLVDISPMPPANEPRATVAGIDTRGNLVYCSPSMEGFESRPLAMPDAGWGQVTRMALYGERLYILDGKGNMIYYFTGENGVFNDKPHLYFSENIPKLDDVIDFTVDQEFLYLLHDDGQMTICEGGGYSLAQTRCTDTPYGDSRPGYEPSPLTFQGARFLQVQATQPPDPSLFALDSVNKSVYHLSLRRLNLQRQYRPQVITDFPLPNRPATAFSIAPNRRILIAFGNQVFYAPIP